MKTKVLLTVDVEFSIAGAFAKPEINSPIGPQCVMGKVNGRSEGLQFVLDTLRSNKLAATFFVEAMQTMFFGDEPMREICVRLQEAGHDIQLHLHPVWGFIGREDWKRRLAIETPNDDMDGRSVNQLVDWMQYGQETFKRWKLPDPVAFRSGSNRVDRNLYRAMSAVGLRLASNIARGIFEPRDHALRLSGGAHQIENVVEMPVTSYFSRFGWPLSRCRALTITGTSLMELIQILEQAHAQRAQVVTLLTHCHEFVRGDPSNALEVNRINQERWTALCRFLHDCADRFEVVSISEFGQSAVLEPSDQHQEIRLPFGMGVKRMVQNKLNEYGLA